jgi:hypothetical protein
MMRSHIYIGVVGIAACRAIRTAHSKIMKRIDTDRLPPPIEVITLAHDYISFGSEIAMQWGLAQCSVLSVQSLELIPFSGFLSTDIRTWENSGLQLADPVEAPRLIAPLPVSFCLRAALHHWSCPRDWRTAGAGGVLLPPARMLIVQSTEEKDGKEDDEVGEDGEAGDVLRASGADADGIYPGSWFPYNITYTPVLDNRAYR